MLKVIFYKQNYFRWTAVDVDNYPPDVEIISFTLTGLQGFTQYAFYVKAYTSTKVAQSVVQYFHTLPGKPSTVAFLTATENKDSEIVRKVSY